MNPRQVRFLCSAETTPRSRLTTFFRIFLLIPHMIVLWLFAIVATIAIVIAWFAIVFTTRFPEGLYDLVAKYLRYSTAVSGYAALLTDRFPPFLSPPPGQTFEHDLQIPPRQEHYSRAKTGFRILHAIPVTMLRYGLSLMLAAAAFLSWVSIVFTGRQSPRFREATIAAFSYVARGDVYTSLLTEDWPSLLERDGAPADVPVNRAGGPGHTAYTPVPAPAPIAPPPAPGGGAPPPPPGFGRPS